MDDHKKELMRYRLQTAKERLSAAKSLLQEKCYKDSVNRSYYENPVGKLPLVTVCR